MRIAVIKNIVAPYTTQVFEALAGRPGVDLLVVYEARTESNRYWETPDELPYEHVFLDSRSVDLRRFVPDAYMHLPRGTSRVLQRFGPDAVIASGAGSWSSLSNLVALRRR